MKSLILTAAIFVAAALRIDGQAALVFFVSKRFRVYLSVIGLSAAIGANAQPSFDTNSRWLESAILDRTNIWLWLHGTAKGENYQLLSTTNLSSTNWDLGEIIWYTHDGGAEFPFRPMTNSMRFFRAHHAQPMLALFNVQNSIVPDSAHTNGQVGIMGMWNETGWGPTNYDITAYYTISGGAAQSGIDYSNLSGVVTIPAGTNYAPIYIYPIENGLKPGQTIILKLAQNTNYLIDTVYLFATNRVN